MTDQDVTLLQEYSTYVSGIGTALSAIVNNAQTLVTALQNSTNSTDEQNAQAIAQKAGQISTIVVPLYASELAEASSDLQSLIAGTKSVQAQGDVGVLNDIANWLSTVDENLAPLNVSVEELNTDSTSAQESQAWNAMNVAYNTVYASNTMTPPYVAQQLRRISNRFASLLAGGGTATSTPTPARAAASSSMPIYVGVAAVVVGGAWWLASKGHFLRIKAKRRTR